MPPATKKRKAGEAGEAAEVAASADGGSAGGNTSKGGGGAAVDVPQPPPSPLTTVSGGGGGGGGSKVAAASSAVAASGASASSSTAKTKAAVAAAATNDSKNSVNGSSAGGGEDWRTAVGYKSMSLQDVHDRLRNLCLRVPCVPDGGFAAVEAEAAATAHGGGGGGDGRSDKTEYDKVRIRDWAASLQSVMEEFNLLVACIPPATYVWGADRSGAADQFLGNLSNELVRSQEQLLSRVTPRLNDVLAPVVTLVTDKTVTTKKKVKKRKGEGGGGAEEDDEEEEEVKRNYFKTTFEDPDYVDLCYSMLARNSSLLRQVVLANFDKLLRAIRDYLDALDRDSQHADQRGGYMY